MTPEQKLTRQIALSISLAAVVGNGNDLEQAIQLAEEAIRQAIAEERDACAKVCDEFSDRSYFAAECANAIRARK